MRISRDIGFLLVQGFLGPSYARRKPGPTTKIALKPRPPDPDPAYRALNRNARRSEMKMRFARNLGVLTATAAVALGSTGVALAQHGADDPAPHQSGADDALPHQSGADDAVPHQSGADDARPELRHGADDGKVHHARHRHRRHRHGADDPAGHR
jgi:hypothetical protein